MGMLDTRSLIYLFDKINVVPTWFCRRGYFVTNGTEWNVLVREEIVSIDAHNAMAGEANGVSLRNRSFRHLFEPSARRVFASLCLHKEPASISQGTDRLYANKEEMQRNRPEQLAGWLSHLARQVITRGCEKDTSKGKTRLLCTWWCSRI